MSRVRTPSLAPLILRPALCRAFFLMMSGASGFDIDANSLSNGVIGSISGAQDLTNRRSSSLRDAFKLSGRTSGAFMHDGSLATMESVIAHYNAIPNAAVAPGVAASVDARLRPGGIRSGYN
jgi:hypothetical protein